MMGWEMIGVLVFILAIATLARLHRSLPNRLKMPVAVRAEARHDADLGRRR